MLAEILQRRSPDVLLLANPQADLSDLLEAISLRLDLVGFGSSSGTQALPERVRMLLVRRSIQRAQNRLASALRASSTAASPRAAEGAGRAKPAKAKRPLSFRKSGRLSDPAGIRTRVCAVRGHRPNH